MRTPPNNPRVRRSCDSYPCRLFRCGAFVYCLRGEGRMEIVGVLMILVFSIVLSAVLSFRCRRRG